MRNILKLYRKRRQTPDIAKMIITRKKCVISTKAYKKVEKLNKTMKNEEIELILGMGISLVEV